MKNLNINEQIKKVSLKNMIYPVIILVATIFFFVILPFKDTFAPQELKSVWDYKSSSHSDYIYTTVDELHYSGYNVSRTFDRDYGYYYTLKDNKCLFVLIPISQTPEETLESYKIYGRAVSTDSKHTFNDMLTALSVDLGWSDTGLSAVTEDYIISNADYHPFAYSILFLFLLIFLAFSTYFIGLSFMHYNNPATYPLCPHMDAEDKTRLIGKVNKELNEAVIFNIEDFYLTEHYFVEYNNNKITIIPLMRIIWGYRMGTLNYKLSHRTARYNLFFTLKSGDTVIIANKSSDQTQQLLEKLREMNLGIILGYTDSKRKKAKELLKK